MPKRRVGDGKLVKLFTFTRDPSAMIRVTLTSVPIKMKQPPAFLITYVLRGVSSSSFLWSTLSTPPLRTGAPSLPFLPLPDAAVFQWEESGDAAPEANASLRPPPPTNVTFKG